MRPCIPALLLLLSALPACSVVETPRTFRGNKVDADQLKELVPGTSTKADVTSLIGSPTTRATFDDNRWIYISETTGTRVGRTPGILAQEVTVLNFDQGGVLRTIRKLGQDDSRPVQVVSRATPSPGSEASFMQQLLGNVDAKVLPAEPSVAPARLAAGRHGHRRHRVGGGVALTLPSAKLVPDRLRRRPQHGRDEQVERAHRDAQPRQHRALRFVEPL